MNQPNIGVGERVTKVHPHLVETSEPLTRGHAIHTFGDDTITYPLDPEASSAANLAAFTAEIFVNGFIFSAEDLGGGGGTAGDDSFAGLLGTVGIVVWETTGAGIVEPAMFRFMWISKAPNCHIMKRKST